MRLKNESVKGEKDGQNGLRTECRNYQGTGKEAFNQKQAGKNDRS